MIRLLSKSEALEHFLELSAEDRYCRFCVPASDDYITAYIKNASGFFYGDIQLSPLMPRPIVAGVVHIFHHKKSNSTEIAVSVLSDYKGKHIGSRLMYFAQGISEMYHSDRLIISGLGQNSPMIQLAKSCGYNVKTECGEFEGEARTIGADLKTITENNIKLFKIMLGSINE